MYGHGDCSAGGKTRWEGHPHEHPHRDAHAAMVAAGFLHTRAEDDGMSGDGRSGCRDGILTPCQTHDTGTISRTWASAGGLAQRGHRRHQRRLSCPQRRARGISAMHHDHVEVTWSEAATALAVLGLITWLLFL
jgi:hypothetical protein